MASRYGRLGKALKRRRERIEMSREWLSAASGYAPSTIANIERGNHVCGFDIVPNLCEALGTSFIEVLVEAQYLTEEEVAQHVKTRTVTLADGSRSGDNAARKRRAVE